MMKITYLAMASALSVATSGSALANSTPLLPETAESSVSQLQKRSPDFGTYVVEADLAMVPAEQARNNNVVQQKGNFSVVRLSEKQNRVTQDTLVRNIITGELAPLSGNISVLLAQGVNAESLTETFDLTLTSSFPRANIAVFNVDENLDILQVFRQLSEDNRIMEAKIEVLEALHQID